ncbi:hypothetical protein [uncultured Paraglaciecola sp.]|uniref:hypothetical protein n=1 Tax=uncultured Paraglaciecola sp. TaxID=1765024 RepID=UPI0030D9F639|tara:strand:+ start:126149 stop:126601 length:453 start_codon:yes stop_codon:yes gene_type:complete
MYQTLVRASSLFSLFILISACNVRWVSEYDAQIDQGITQLHREMETFLTALEQQQVPECLSTEHGLFYQQSLVDVRALKVRAKAIPNNDITLQQLNLLEENLSLMLTLHQTQDRSNSCMAPGMITFNRSNFESIFIAILKFELAKKRQVK